MCQEQIQDELLKGSVRTRSAFDQTDMKTFGNIREFYRGHGAILQARILMVNGAT